MKTHSCNREIGFSGFDLESRLIPRHATFSRIEDSLTVEPAEIDVHPDVEASRRPRRLPLDDLFAVDDHLGVAQSPLDLEGVPLEREQGVLPSQDSRACMYIYDIILSIFDISGVAHRNETPFQIFYYRIRCRIETRGVDP